MRNLVPHWFLAGLAVAATGGCGGGDAPLLDVSGTVTYQRQAVAGGTVLLQPTSGKAVVAVIDELGRYRASLARGDYRVAVVASAAIPDGVDPWNGKAALPAPLVPDKYGRPETSNTSLTVAPENTTIDISLQ